MHYHAVQIIARRFLPAPSFHQCGALVTFSKMKTLCFRRSPFHLFMMASQHGCYLRAVAVLFVLNLQITLARAFISAFALLLPHTSIHSQQPRFFAFFACCCLRFQLSLILSRLCVSAVSALVTDAEREMRPFDTAGLPYILLLLCVLLLQSCSWCRAFEITSPHIRCLYVSSCLSASAIVMCALPCF